MAQEKRNKILVPDGVRKKLRDCHQTTYPTVRKALNGTTNSKLATKIRHTALKHFGGVEVSNQDTNI